MSIGTPLTSNLPLPHDEPLPLSRSRDVRPHDGAAAGSDDRAIEGVEIDATESDGQTIYRTLSVQALVGVCLSLLSFLAYFDGWLAILAFGGAYLGWRAWSNIRENPDQWSGLAFAKFAMALGVANFFGSIGLNSYIYATEVPDGHRRINYEILQPDTTIKGERIPETAFELNGQPVFIKGYIHPATPIKEGIHSFVLVRDRKECCFGNTPKITDKILVQVANPGGINYDTWMVKASGTFRVDLSQPDVVLYYLDGANVK